jgi:hypothetical protein
MPIRLLLAATALAAAAGTAAPASAADICAFVYARKDSPVKICVPYGPPLPEFGCLVRVEDVLVVCNRPL